VSGVLENMTDTGTADVTRAEGLVRQALAASPLDPLAHYAKGEVLRVQGRPEEALPEFETVLAFDGNATNALFHVGWCKLMTGSIDEVIPLAEQLIRLSPRVRALPIVIGGSAWCISCNRILTMPSSGSKSPAAPIRDFPGLT
jgi:tetratricopeptide (TPR) repeat protein